MNASLSQTLRHETQALHRAAERAGIMPALLHGRLPRADYIVLLHQLQMLYQALEQGLARAGAPPVPVALQRLAALRADLDWLDPGAETPAPTPTMRQYVQHLQQVAATAPTLLAAHAYVRYLGDLAGGQVLARIVARAYGLVGDEGLHFYHFGPPEGHAALVRALRGMLDALPAADAPALVAEAQDAFRRHVRLFEDLVR